MMRKYDYANVTWQARIDQKQGDLVHISTDGNAQRVHDLQTAVFARQYSTMEFEATNTPPIPGPPVRTAVVK